MKILKIYLDTSVFSFALADDAPKEREVTLKLLEEIRNEKYEPFIS